MIAVIFEAFPADGECDKYFDIASRLKPELIKIEGFISIERFQSVSNPKRVLSLSIWQTEETIAQWRNLEIHRNAQNEGRNSIFSNYRIRIANVVRDYGMNDRKQAPGDSEIIHR